MNTFTKLQIQFYLVLFLLMGSVHAQQLAGITVTPENATAYDEITLTFDPSVACFENGSLVGLPYIAMHSGVTSNGSQWQHVVEFNATGANGQSPVLSLNADGTYSITFTPFDFYAFNPGEFVTQICAVFNNGTDWSQDGRDYDSGGTACMDFFIPILPGSPPGDPFLTSVVPDNADQGASLTVQIMGTNTHFQADVNDAWLELAGEIINFSTTYAVNDSTISAQIDIPGSATPAAWNVNVYNSTDDTISLLNAFTINDTSTNVLPILTMDPPNATAYDEITLTLDARLSCPSGSLFDADSVMMHSGVTIDDATWTYVVSFDTLGANGLAPKLNYNGDTTWSITYTPADFYGFPAGTVVQAINCVFNAGDWSAGEGKDFDNGGNCTDFYMPLESTVGIHEGSSSAVKIFPNPAGGQLHVVSELKIISYSVYSVFGQLLINHQHTSGRIQRIDLSDLPAGIYFLNLQSASNKWERFKFVKQ